jgi:hypothetical protein
VRVSSLRSAALSASEVGSLGGPCRRLLPITLVAWIHTTKPIGLSSVLGVAWLQMTQSYSCLLTKPSSSSSAVKKNYDNRINRLRFVYTPKRCSSDSMAFSMNCLCLEANSSINFCCLSLALLLLSSLSLFSLCFLASSRSS